MKREYHLCVCGHREERHEQCRLKFQPCYFSGCVCKDYHYERTIIFGSNDQNDIQRQVVS